MKKKVIIPVIASIITVLILSGVSYAYYSAKIKENNKTETILKSNELNLIFTGTKEITANNMIPGDSFTKTFTVENTSNRAVDYNIYMENIINEFNEDLVYTLEDTTGSVIDETPLPVTNKDKSYLKTGISIEANTIKTYTLKITFKNTDEPQNDYQGKTFKGTLGIDTKKINKEYKEALLNGTDPVLSDNLVPVVLSDDGTVTKADINTEWYKYEDKKWANAVILADNTKTYNNGDIIPEDNIESYFVWIPKYSYQIFNLGETDGYTSGKPTTSNAQEIQIKFGTTNTNDSNNGECTTPMTSGASGNCKVGDYMTSPAFISMDTNGLWTAKFETTGSTTNITVKPNQTSLRNINVKTMFETAYNYKRDNDSHMMKNTEWGAVAYLSHSKYGINTEVRINNNSNYITGYAATDSSDQSKYPGTTGTDASVTLPYNTSTGYKASTTGNITGIYDMSGGAYEYMASLRSETYGSSGFDATTLKAYNSKYYEEYDKNSDIYAYSKRILGDATGEMGPFYYYQDGDDNWLHNAWYADGSYFVQSSDPWFGRGGGSYYYSVLAGQLYFDRGNGGTKISFAFRLVLTK